MAITINSEPGAVELLEDGLFLDASTNLYIVNTGGQAINVFIFAAPTVCDAGQVINFVYADVSFEVVVSDSPDNSGYQIPSRSGYFSDVAHRDDVINYLNKNYFIKRDFEMTGGAVVGSGAMLINFTSKFVGDNYQFDQSSSLVTIPNAQITSNQAGQGTLTRENFKLVASIINETEEGSGLWERMPEIKLTPDTTNQKVIFQLQRYLRSLVNGVDWPTLGQNTPYLCKNINRKYQVLLSEYYGATPQYYNLNELPIKRVLFGGNLKPHRSKNTGYFTQAGGQKNWLSWFSLNRYLTLLQDGFAAYFNDSDQSETLRLMVNVTYDDGSTSGNTQIFEQIIPAGTVYNFPIGWEQLNLGSLDQSKQPTQWRVQLYSYIEQISNWGAWSKALICYEEPVDYLDRFIYFQNTLGGVIEVARLRGEFEKGITVSSDDFLQDLDPETIDGFGQMIRTDVVAIYTYELSTGFLSKDELQPYIQLLMTKNAAIVDDDQLIEVIIEPGSFEIIRKESSVGLYLYAFNFKARRTTLERGFSL